MQIPISLGLSCGVNRSTCAIIRKKRRFVKHFFEIFCRNRKKDALSREFLRDSVGRFLIVWEIYCDFFKIAIQDLAQHIQSVGAHAVVFAQTIKLTGAEMVVLDELILRDTTIFHRSPKGVIRDHRVHHPNITLIEW
jgi:hypothetical protein